MAILRQNFHVWNFLFSFGGGFGPIGFWSSRTCPPPHLCCDIGGLHPATKSEGQPTNGPAVEPKDLFQCFNESKTNIILKDRLKKRQNNVSRKKHKKHRTLLPQRQNPERLVGEMRELTEIACYFFRYIHDVSDAWLQCWLIMLMTFQKRHGDRPRQFIRFSMCFVKFSVPFLCHTRVASLYRGRGSALRKPSNDFWWSLN